jgi:hypothetical protein
LRQSRTYLLLWWTRTIDGSLGSTHDLENRLLSVGSPLTLTYDPLGRLRAVEGTAVKIAFGGVMGYANDQAMGGNSPLTSTLGGAATVPAPAWIGLAFDSANAAANRNPGNSASGNGSGSAGQWGGCPPLQVGC